MIVTTSSRRPSARPEPLTRLQKIRRRLLLIPVYLFLWLLQLIGPQRIRRLAAHPDTGSVVTWLIKKLLRRKRLYCNSNFDLILASLPKQQRQAVQTGFYQNMLVAIATSMSLRPDSRLLQTIRTSGLEHLQGHDEGIIFVTCHLYGWELSRLNLFRQGYPVYSLYRDFSDSFFNHRRFNHKNRFLDLSRYIPTWKTREMVKKIADGENAFLFADVRNKKGRNGKLIPFCGHPAWTSTFAAQMALKYNRPLIPVYIHCDEHGQYHQYFEAPIDQTSADPVVITTLINDSMSRQIMARPQDWALWDNNRWGI
jgi:lauroyl/myristoyl acyltransferase